MWQILSNKALDFQAFDFDQAWVHLIMDLKLNVDPWKH